MNIFWALSHVREKHWYIMSSTSFPVTLEPVPLDPPNPLMRTGRILFSSGFLFDWDAGAVPRFDLDACGVLCRLLELGRG